MLSGSGARAHFGSFRGSSLFAGTFTRTTPVPVLPSPASQKTRKASFIPGIGSALGRKSVHGLAPFHILGTHTGLRA